MPGAPEAFSCVLIDQALRESGWDLPTTSANSGTSVAHDYGCKMQGAHSMSKYQKGDHVKIEVTDEQSAETRILRTMRWRVIRVWEHDLKTSCNEVPRKVVKAYSARRVEHF
jgi:hypothetical protein